MKLFNYTYFSVLLIALGSSSLFAGSQGAHPAYSGPKKIAILLVEWQDRGAPASRQTVVDRIWNNSNSLRKYYLDMSRNAMDFVPPTDAAPDGTVPASTYAVYGPYELSIAAGFHQDVTVANAESLYGGKYLGGTHSVAETLAAADGFDPADYDYVMYVTPKAATTGGLGGYAGVNATYSHMFDMRQNYINHELGHNFGLSHSNTSIDSDGYGSQDCVMGNGANAHLDGVHTYNMGWYPDANFSKESYGQYDIENLAEDTDNLKVVRFDRGLHGATTKPTYQLWVGYRVKGVGQDAGLSNSWNRKINVHYCKEASPRPYDDSNYYYYLNNNVSWFSAGGSYTDPDDLCEVRFLRENTAAGSAVVQFIDPNGNQPPSIPEQSIHVPPGTTDFSIQVDDPENDDLTFTIISGPSVGTLTVSDSTFTYTGSTLGSYSFTVRVNDGHYDSFDQSITLTVVGTSSPTVNAGPDQTVSLIVDNPWSPAFTPTVVWFDASDASTITEASGAVSQWADKSGNGDHAVQATGSRKPTYDALNNKLTFDGGDILGVTNDPFNGLQNFAVIAVQKWDTSKGWGNVSAAFHGDSSNGWQIRQRGSAFDQMTFTRRGTSGTDDPTPSSTVNNSDFIGSCIRQNSKDISIRHNGLETFSATNDGGTIPYTGSNRSSIGGRFGGDNWASPGNYLAGELKEVIVLENALDADVEMVEGYFAHKWGLTASLPAGHPYQSVAPSGDNVVVALDGTVNDSDGDQLTTSWSVISGPGAVLFSNTSTEDTNVTFFTPGAYVLRLTTTDGLTTVSDDVTITVIGQTGPEIDVFGNFTQLTNGDTTPSTGDGTYFGTVSSGSSLAHTFSIFNFGDTDLTLSGTPKVSVSGSSAFSVTTQPSSPISSATNSDFTVTFSPTDNDVQYAVITISNNDSDESTYTFTVAGNIPAVEVTATDANANESGPDTGTWTIARTGGTSTDLTVYFSLSGTATESTDYTTSSTGQVTIPAGSSSATVTLTPVADSDIEGTETAVLTIVDDLAYFVGNTSDTITISEPDSIQVTTPNGGELFLKQATSAIEWQSLAGGNVKIDLIKGGAFHSEISASTPNNGSFEWTVPLALPTSADYRIRVSLLPGGSVTDTSDADFTIISDPLAEALDTTDLSWSTFGSANWFYQTTTTHDGIDAAESGDIDDRESAYLTTTVTGPGTLTFWWKVSSETNYDYLKFIIDESVQDLISGDVDWVQKTITIPAGQHFLQWEYSKDSSVSSNLDTAWVDQVVYTPSTGGPIPDTNLPSGISLFGYVGADPIDAQVAFQGLIDNNQLSLVRCIDPSNGSIKELYYTAFPTPGWVNEIDDLTLGQGYVVKTTQACTLSISGNKDTSSVSHNLPAGYSIVGFNQETPLDAYTAFLPLIDTGKLDIVRWVDPSNGSVKELYYSSFPTPGWVNEIGNLTEGQGYIIKLNSSHSGFQLP